MIICCSVLSSTLIPFLFVSGVAGNQRLARRIGTTGPSSEYLSFLKPAVPGGPFILPPPPLLYSHHSLLVYLWPSLPYHTVKHSTKNKHTSSVVDWSQLIMRSVSVRCESGAWRSSMGVNSNRLHRLRPVDHIFNWQFRPVKIPKHTNQL